MIYKYEDLENLKVEELEVLKKGKQLELYNTKKKQNELITNILHLQRLIEEEEAKWLQTPEKKTNG